MTKRIRDINWPLGPLTPEDLPGGKYLVSFRKAERGIWFRQHKIRLEYEIVEPIAFAGLLVSFFATHKEDQNKRPSKQSKFYQLWVRVNGGSPRRGQRMSPNIFEGYWQVQVAWGRDKEDQPTKPYVAELLERVAGGGAI